MKIKTKFLLILFFFIFAPLLVKYSYEEYLDRRVKYKGICTSCEIKMPKIIHRIWMVWDPQNPDVPAVYKEFDHKLRQLHPDWQIMEWDDAKVEAFIKMHYPDFWETYIHYDKPVKKHDASRLLILNYYGGVFVQHSLNFAKSMNDLVKGYELVFMEQKSDERILWNGYMASIPAHPVFQNITQALKHSSTYDILASTGPVFVTRLIDSYTKSHNKKGLNILPPQHLLPFNWTQKNTEPIYSNCIIDHDKCFKLYPDAYGYCLWTGAWIKQ